MKTLVLQPGRDRSVRRRHPWLMSGAIARIEGAPEAGELVAVRSAEGELLAHGHFEPGSQIRVRLLAFGKEPLEESALAGRLAAALARRSADPLLAGTDAIRLVNAEGDGLPGLVVDRYAGVLVVRPSTSGMLRRVATFAATLREASGAGAALLRPDAVSLRRSGVEAGDALLWGAAPEAPVTIAERGRRYRVDVLRGQKTGFYLDQRDARDLVAALATGRRVLDAFAYTGGFAVAALEGGAAHVLALESSQGALGLARENVAFAGERAECLAADAFAALHARAVGTPLASGSLRASGRVAPLSSGELRASGHVAPLASGELRASGHVAPLASGSLRASGHVAPLASGSLRASLADDFDLVILDPPPLARRKADVQRASRAYKDLLLHAFAGAAPGRLVLAFACSHHVGPDLFGKIAFGAALDAGRRVSVLRELGAPSDHPVSLDHPEGRYLTGLLLRIDG